MADVVTMPKLGFDMAEGTLSRWVKAEGDQVQEGELLAEIETDKATVEVESAYSGTVRKHLVTEGASVPVNEPIAVIGGADEDIDFDSLGGGAAAAEAPAEEEKPAEEEAPAEEPQAEAQTEAAAPKEGAQAAPDGNGHLPDGVKASPLARRIAQENDVDISRVAGSGPGGRIVKVDVEAFMESPPPAAAATKEAAQAAPAVKDAGTSGPPLPALAAADFGPAPADERVPLSRLRAAIGRRMVQSRQEVPHFYVTYEYDVSELMALRKQANSMLAGTGEKLSVNDFILKAAALNLRNFPNLNARLEGEEIVRFGRINLAVAVAVENGLLTVVCHDTDRKSLRQIAAEVRAKADRVRSGKVQSEDIEGSTFSTSNLGMFGVDEFIAIINPPEAAILALGAAKQVPVVEDGELTVGWRMKATISVDHRVSDGAEAADFMQSLKNYLENPLSLML